MKKIILSLVFLSFVLCNVEVNAQAIKGNGVNLFLSQQQKKDKTLQNAFPQRFCVYKIDNKEYISLILRVKPESDLAFVEKYDAMVGSRQGRIVTIRLNVEELEAFCQEKDILEIETSRAVATEQLNNAAKDLKVADVHNGVELLQSYTGRDVLIGIADWGVDYTHPTFYDTLINEYRILAAWDQYRNQGPAPEGFTYGSLADTKEKLLEFGTDTCGIYDTAYHATHVAGITGGGGAGTNYRGLAIDAKWLFCSWLRDEASVMDGYTWMRNYAKSVGKRIVINNSWGVYLYGTMDGTSMLDEFINTMSDNDSIVFVVSAGNNGSSPFHIKADFSEADTLKSEVMFDNAGTSDEFYWGETISMQGEGNTTFSSCIEVYDYAWQKVYQTPWIDCSGMVVDETQYELSEGNTMTYRASSRYPQDNRSLVDWEVAYTHPGNYHTILVLAAQSGVVHAWNVACLSKAIGNWGYEFKASREEYLQGNDEYGLSEPALAEKTIAVAAYRYKPNVWTPTITDFSSRGPNMVSYMKPDIAAPGKNIISSVNSYSTGSPTSNNIVSFEGRDYHFSALSGTSMSGPMVSGAVALMLEANPNLTPDEVKQIIIETARTDSYTEECPNYTWGYGKLDVYAAVKKAEQKVGIANIENNAINVYPVPASDNLYIKGVENNSQIYIFDMLGREILATKMNNNTINISSLTEGVYMLKLNDKGNWKKVKFIKK